MQLSEKQKTKSRRDERAEKLHQYVLAHSSEKKYICFRESSLARAKIRRLKREETDVMMRDVIFSNSGIKINRRANVRFGGDVDACFCRHNKRFHWNELRTQDTITEVKRKMVKPNIVEASHTSKCSY